MFPFPAIKNVFTNRGFVQRRHGHRIYLQAGETSAQNSAGQGLETFYGDQEKEVEQFDVTETSRFTYVGGGVPVSLYNMDGV